MRISDWSSDVCSSDLQGRALVEFFLFGIGGGTFAIARYLNSAAHPHHEQQRCQRHANRDRNSQVYENRESKSQHQQRSDEHTSALQSLMRISYAVFCLNTNKPNTRSRHPPNLRPNT